MTTLPLRLGLACLLCLAASTASAEPLALEVIQRRLDPERKELTRVSALEFRGALEITSPHPAFGGLSGMEIDADGSRMTAVSDKGNWITARLRYDETGRLSGLEDGTVAPILDPAGRTLDDKYTQDAESLAMLPDGSFLVAFERQHRLWRYAANLEPGRHNAVPWPSPPGLKSLPENLGLEAIAALADGRLLAITENAIESAGGTSTGTAAGTSTGGSSFPAFLWDGKGWKEFSYRRKGEFRPSGLALLPDGDVLVLERSFSWLGGIAARLVRVPAAAFKPGAVIEGEELAALAPPLITDNWEGLAVRQAPNGETLVYLLSDDNFLLIQRNLLVMFALLEK